MCLLGSYAAFPPISYGPASDAGPPTLTTVAGLISPGSPDLNYNAAAAVAKVEHVLILSYDGFHQVNHLCPLPVRWQLIQFSPTSRPT